MLIELLLSMFGFAIVYRNLSLLEKIEVISTQTLKYFFIFLQFPLYLHLFFKELRAFVIFYIGIFGITLILSSKIKRFFRKRSFKKMYLNIITRILLHLSTGKSAQMSVKAVWDELSASSKTIFVPLQNFFQIKKHVYKHENSFENFYFEELEHILTSNSHVAEQLSAFRTGLALHCNLRHRSRQILLQIKAQAIVCVCLYVVIAVFAHLFLGLRLYSTTMLISLSLFVLGQFLIFKIGTSIKWKT